jgi:hypothetical protein
MVLTDRKSNPEAGVFREHCRQTFKQMVADTTNRQQTTSRSEFRIPLSASDKCIVRIRMMEFYLGWEIWIWRYISLYFISLTLGRISLI